MPETSFFLPLVLQSAVVPLVVALAVLAIVRAARPRAPAALLALVAGFLASYFLTMRAQWSLVPRVALDWLPWITVLAAAAAFAVERLPAAAARIALRSVVSLGIAGLLVSGAVASLGVQKAVLSALVIGLVLSLLWTLSPRPAQGPATRPLLLMVAAGGTGLALMVDSSQSIGQLSGALAMTLAACTLFALPRLATPFGPAAAATAVLVLGTLLAAAHLYAGFSLGYVALLGAGLLIDPVFGALRRSREGGLPWVPAAVLTAIPVLVTVVLAVKAMQETGGY